MFDLTTILRALGGSLAGFLMLVGSCLTTVTQTGCKSLSEAEMRSQTAQMQAWTQFAKDNGVMFVGQVAYTGKGGLYAQNLWGVDLGVQAQGFFVFDPQRMEPK